MKVAFATIYDPLDVRRGSGTLYHIAKEIERQGHTVYYIGPLEPRESFLTRGMRWLSRWRGRRYVTLLDVHVCRRRGRLVGQQLAGMAAEVLLTNDYGVAAFTNTALPIVLYPDYVFPYDYSQNVDPAYARFAWYSVRMAQQVNHLGLCRSQLCVFPSRLVAGEAMRYSGVSPDRILIVPFGANIEDPTRAVAQNRKLAKNRDGTTLALLFVGKDWVRKGGDIAVGVVSELQRRGIKAVLHIVGATPPYNVDGELVKVYGLLDKTDPVHRGVIDQLYRECAALILPTKHEGFVIAALEAAAYGMPVVSYNTHGLTDAVIHGETGVLLKPSEGTEAFADVVEEWLRNPSTYDHLVTGARRHYEETVNWRSAVGKLMAEVERRFGGASS